MARGRQGFWLEGGKFAIYLIIPLAASMHYNNPENQKKAADYWQYVKYPANPATGWKEHIEKAASQQKQREAYQHQLQQLNSSAVVAVQESNVTTQVSNRMEWLRWIGWGRSATSSRMSDNDTETAASESSLHSSPAAGK
jgi:hypothetical protein